MHTAEVEDILLEGENLEKVFIGKIKSVNKHPESDKLNCTIASQISWPINSLKLPSVMSTR